MLQQILKEPAEPGADTVQLECADEGLEITFMFGHTGVGNILIKPESESEVINSISRQAHLQKSSHGLMGMTLSGEPYAIIVEKYESFGESAFRLRLQKSSERQT